MSTEQFLWALSRTTLLVLLSGLLVQVLLRQSRYNRFARVCWFSVLLSGWIWMPFFSWSIPWFEQTEPASVSSVLETSETVFQSVVSSSQSFAPETPTEIVTETVSPIIVAKPPAVFGLSAIPGCLLGLWLAGISGIVVFRLAVYLRCLLLLGKTVLANQSESTDWAVLLREHKIDPRGIPLCFSENLGPSLLGTPLGYRLVIPRMIWDELSPAAREGVLRHELTHFLRRDIAKSLLARFLALPHWFNPLARLAVRRFEEAAEYRCDEAAFAPTQEGQSAFAEALLTLHESVEHVVVFRHAIWGNGLANRIAYILNIETRKELSTMKKTAVIAPDHPFVCCRSDSARVRRKIECPALGTRNRSSSGTGAGANRRNFRDGTRNTRPDRSRRKTSSRRGRRESVSNSWSDPSPRRHSGRERPALLLDAYRKFRIPFNKDR